MHLCGADGPLIRMDPEEHQRQLKKKQNNRAAAQRSRQKHTNKADALHQQHESLEKHNHTLRKEIQALQAELAWWSRTLHMHERLCPMDCASCLAPVSPGRWGQAEWPPGPVCPGQHGCQEQPGPFRTPVSSPMALQLSPDPQPHGSLGLLLSPLPSLSLGPAPVTASSAQPSPSPVQSASPTGSGLLRSSSKLSTLLPSPPAQPPRLQSLGLEHPTRGKLASSTHSPSAPLGLGFLQGREHKACFPRNRSARAPPPLAFPLLSSAQVYF
ncbi:basic leucine zipper transcriptional factor ATF-like 2 isoform X1 [Monodon monoceros]|uniref:Basic leucine zipper transcriptional factor ATF-like 2 n=2 Tax=Monodontidae TaxID=9747 RepID=A0A8C6CIF7_MONMO|nr:basic leucine zipper transcriptional factor ATF-like 2 isoform X1 [Delphinapterus leucas]XP_029064488.1 basic leucine zipper transcriptional factor ATF-like 2 isoform X1 [Monodon monoceros]